MNPFVRLLAFTLLLGLAGCGDSLVDLPFQDLSAPAETDLSAVKHDAAMPHDGG